MSPSLLANPKKTKGIVPPARLTAALFIAIAMLLLNACTLAPGIYLDDSRFEQEPTSMDIAQGAIPLIPIDAELIQRQNEAQDSKKNNELSEDKDLAAELASYEYRVGPQDILAFNVWDHPELTIPAGEFRPAEIAGHRVDSLGMIFFPYVGKVKVAGLSLPQIRKLITQRLKHYIPDPQLDVRVVSFRSQKTFVTGEVETPTTLPIDDVPLTVVDAINRAEGPTEEADLQQVRISRSTPSGIEQDQIVDVQAILDDGETQRNVLLRNGDVVHVADREQNKIFVLGEIAEPSVKLMHKGRMTLADIIGQSGGLDKTAANAKFIYVIRGEEQQPNTLKPVVFHLDAEQPDALLLSTRFELEPLDLVYVSTAGVSRFHRVMRQLLPTWGALLGISALAY
jgi:polysaccharide export outer membrane protein